MQACVCICRCLQRSENGTRFPGTEVAGSCDGCWDRWELNSSPLWAQQVLLMAEQSF